MTQTFPPVGLGHPPNNQRQHTMKTTENTPKNTNIRQNLNDPRASQPIELNATNSRAQHQSQENNRGSYRGRNQRGGFRNQRSQRNSHLNIFPALNEDKNANHKKFFLIKAKDPSIENLWLDLDTIQANHDLERSIQGTPTKITELRNGSILVQTANQLQSTKIVQIDKLHNTEVIVQEHPTLNRTKGTIRSERFAKLSNEALLGELSKFNVTDIYKMQKKEGNTYKNSGTIILTFDTCVIPSTVKIGWTNLDVREYIANPRQCYRCQKFNHSAKSCRATSDICNRCGEPNHRGMDCNKPEKCVNCKKPHRSSDRKCFFYIFEKEIETIKTREHCSYKDAKAKVLQMNFNPNKSYASLLKEKTTARNQNRWENQRFSESQNITQSQNTNLNRQMPHTQNRFHTMSDSDSSDTSNPSRPRSKKRNNSSVSEEERSHKKLAPSSTPLRVSSQSSRKTTINEEMVEPPSPHSKCEQKANTTPCNKDCYPPGNLNSILGGFNFSTPPPPPPPPPLPAVNEQVTIGPTEHDLNDNNDNPRVDTAKEVSTVGITKNSSIANAVKNFISKKPPNSEVSSDIMEDNALTQTNSPTIKAKSIEHRQSRYSNNTDTNKKAPPFRPSKDRAASRSESRDRKGKSSQPSIT